MKNLTQIAVEQQIAAMGCEVYEIGLFKPHTPGSDSREPEMLPRTWDYATLLKSVPWLRYQNSQGRNIYIRPKGEHHLSMVDDLTADAVQRMKAEGYAPVLVVETSPDNFQAWLDHGEVLPQRLSTLVARALAEKFGGDKGAADWRHFGRLGGFTNQKAKYYGVNGKFPFVRIADGPNKSPYYMASQLLRSARTRAEASGLNSVTGRAAPATERRLLTIQDFRLNPRYGGDGNRVDLAFAIYAFSHGMRQDVIEAALRTRDLSKKGSAGRISSYVLRTIAKAQMGLGGFTR